MQCEWTLDSEVSFLIGKNICRLHYLDEVNMNFLLGSTFLYVPISLI